jgi:hypothetical protein
MEGAQPSRRSLATAVVVAPAADPIREAFSWATWFLTAVLAGAMLFHVVRAGFGGGAAATVADDDTNAPAPAPAPYAPPSFAAESETAGGPVAAR